VTGGETHRPEEIAISRKKDLFDLFQPGERRILAGEGIRPGEFFLRLQLLQAVKSKNVRRQRHERLQIGFRHDARILDEKGGQRVASCLPEGIEQTDHFGGRMMDQKKPHPLHRVSMGFDGLEQNGHPGKIILQA